MHPAAVARGVVIEALQMEEAMDEIKAQLMPERGPVRLSLPSSGFHTDKDLAMLKSDHVGGAGNPEKATVQFAHLAIGNKQDLDLFQAR